MTEITKPFAHCCAEAGGDPTPVWCFQINQHGARQSLAGNAQILP